MNSESKKCEKCEKDFEVLPADLEMYGKMDLPSSSMCPKCRLRYFTSFWIFGRFRIVESDLSGKRIITVLPESVPFPIYEREEFVGDGWDPLEYGQDYDSGRSFIDQVLELQAKVPHPHQVGTKNTNCDWADDVWNCKNCYLTRSAAEDEDLSYCYRIIGCKNSMDLTQCFELDNSYDCTFCFKSYNLRHSFNSRDCVDSSFLYDCRGSNNCFMSWNLRNKQYCIRNKQYSKEDYFAELENIDTETFSGIQKLKEEFNEHLRDDALHRADFNIQTNNVAGNFITESKNMEQCFFIEKSENCRYCLRDLEIKDCIDCIGALRNSASATTVMDQLGYGNAMCLYTTNTRYSVYCDSCEDCEYCFGCIGLRKKKYCILNKQYSEGEYKALVEKIKADMKARGEWGRFFPQSAAYSGYNTSLAQLYFPMDRGQAEKFGAKWDDGADSEHVGMKSENLPESIDGVSDDITKQRIICSDTGLSYNISPSELVFYKEKKLPLPRRHFDKRTLDHMKPFSKMLIPQRGACAVCNKEFEHYYSPELGYKKIACVECYQQEVS